MQYDPMSHLVFCIRQCPGRAGGHPTQSPWKNGCWIHAAEVVEEIIVSLVHKARPWTCCPDNRISKWPEDCPADWQVIKRSSLLEGTTEQLQPHAWSHPEYMGSHIQTGKTSTKFDRRMRRCVSYEVLSKSLLQYGCHYLWAGRWMDMATLTWALQNLSKRT